MMRLWYVGVWVFILFVAACGTAEPDTGLTGSVGGSTNTNTASTNTNSTNTNTTATNTVPDLPSPGTIELGTPVLPYILSETRDTSTSTNDSIDSYSGYIQDESGPEYLYRFTVADWVLLNASVSGMTFGTDIDLHLCKAADDGSLSNVAAAAQMVIARHDSVLQVILPAGTYYLITDTYMHNAGSFDLQLSLSDVSASVTVLPVSRISHATNDTATSALDALDSYSGFSQDESGPERIYRLTIESNCTITAGLYNMQSGADIDLHLLPAGPCGALVLTNGVVGAPIVRHNIALRADLVPGSYFLIADSYMGKSGSFSLRTGFRSEGVTIWDSFVDLGRILTDAEVPDAVWYLGRSIDYITAHRPNDFLSIIGPPGHWDSVDVGMSACALTACGIWRALGIDEPEIRDAYNVGMAVANVQTIGIRHGCITYTGSLSSYPQRGDTIDIATSSTNYDHHVFMVSSDPVLSGNTLTFRAIHGGQVTTDGRQLIKEIVTTAVWTGSAWDVNGRKIMWWVETEKIPRTINGWLPADAVGYFQ